jgi:hypothetical protein
MYLDPSSQPDIPTAYKHKTAVTVGRQWPTTLVEDRFGARQRARDIATEVMGLNDEKLETGAIL